MVCDTPPYSHAPTYQLSFTYLERQKCYGPDKKILFKKQLFDLKVKVPRRSLRYATHCLIVMHPHTKYHWPISKDKKVMIRTSFAEKKWKKKQKKKIRLKQYVSLRSKGGHNYLKICSQCLSSLKFWLLVTSVLHTSLCEKVCNQVSTFLLVLSTNIPSYTWLYSVI